MTAVVVVEMLWDLSSFFKKQIKFAPDISTATVLQASVVFQVACLIDKRVEIFPATPINVTYGEFACGSDQDADRRELIKNMRIIYLGTSNFPGFQPRNTTDELLMGALNKYGPLSITYYPPPKFMKRGEVLTSEACYKGFPSDVRPPNHACGLLVGYGFDKKSGKKYWKIKESLGTNFADDGYFMMERNNKNTCGLYDGGFGLEIQTQGGQ